MFSISDAQFFLNLAKRLEDILMALERLIEQVTAIEDRSQSIIALVNGLAEEIRRIGTDQEALNDLADRLEAQSGQLQEAVDANTPQEPTG